MESKVYVPAGIIISEEEYNQLSEVGRTKLESEQGAMAICPAHNDHKPSLWLKINKDEKGRYWLNQKCHAGCSNEEVFEALGLDYPTMAESSWDYYKADNSYSHTKIKREVFHQGKRTSKSYYQGIRQANGKYDTVDVFKKVDHILYNLPQVQTETGDVYIVEGEKCADALAIRGATTTTADNGADSWRDEFVKVLLNARRVIIIPDQDKAGLDYLYTIARSFLKAGYEEVYRLDLPTTVKKFDVYDWFEAGHTMAELQAVELQKIALEDLPDTTSSSSSSSEWLEKLEMKVSKNGKSIAPILNNYVHILQNHLIWKGVFAENLMLGEIIKLYSPIPKVYPGRMADNGSDLIAMKLWLHETYPELDPSTEMLNDAVIHVAGDLRFHPVQEYLHSLPAWDGTVRLETLLIDLGGAEDCEYTRLVTKKWFIGAVARAMKPGCKMDYTLCLPGGQGGQKSSFFAALVPDPEWFADCNLAFDNKDINFITGGKWIVEFGERVSFRKSDIEAAKQFLTKTHDEWRRPYGRTLVRIPRSCVFSMTCNDIGGFLTDPTGNRRYWPVTVNQSIDPEKVIERRDQLWAEALHYFTQGIHWWPENDHEHELCQQAQEAHYLPDSVEEDLFFLLTVHPIDTITTKEIQDKFPGVSTRRINSIMLNRFKCKKAEKLAIESPQRGTRKGFEINRDVIHGSHVRVEESMSGMSVGKVTDLEERRKQKWNQNGPNPG